MLILKGIDGEIDGEILDKDLHPPTMLAHHQDDDFTFLEN